MTVIKTVYIKFSVAIYIYKFCELELCKPFSFPIINYI